MAEVRPYYSEKGLTATFYDLTTALDPSLAGDIDIYRSLVPEGGSVLELGVCTGRVAFALAEGGLHVTGMIAASAIHRGMLGMDCSTSITRWVSASNQPP